MIRVDHVTKTFPGGVRALDDVSLDIAEGEVFGIIGRSGAGKSTLLRCLNLLDRPTSGRILLDGQDLSALSDAQLRPLRRRIGVVFQQFNLLDSRSVRGNIGFPLEVAGISKPDRERRIDELVDLVDLTDRQYAHPAQLSGGQKQRAGIARALAGNPRLLLCDEPTSALDPETTGQILDLIAELNRALGVTVAIITHELDVVRRICSSAALLEDGRVRDSGRLVDLIADPQSPLGEAILPTAASATGHATQALLTFHGGAGATPLLSKLTRALDVDVSLLAGGVEHVAGRDVGRIRVGFSGAGASAVQEIEDFLTREGVGVVLDGRRRDEELIA
ncbi:methionine ABC transporter ATP-binding protein [Mariniluteicoccus flavus]